jgi:hypothetical protein
LGKSININVQDGKVMINESEVIITDIEATNGVIHVIDAVLLPPADAPETLPVSGGEPSNSAFLILVAAGMFLLLSGAVLRFRLARASQ